MEGFPLIGYKNKLFCTIDTTQATNTTYTGKLKKTGFLVGGAYQRSTETFGLDLHLVRH